MIISRLKGGLGNQFFIYAYSIYVAKTLDRKLFFDNSSYFNLLNKRYNKFCLKFGIKYEINNFFDFKILPDFLSKIYYNLAKLNTRHLKNTMLPFQYDDKSDNDAVNSKYPVIILNGYYIKKDYAIILQNELKLNDLFLSKENTEYLNKIENSESVSIHIRGQQYIYDKNIKSNYASVSLDYYRKAIIAIKETVVNPIFYVFTNDIKYAKELLDIESEIIFLETRGPDYEHFYLMSKCKHNIIINSTFSWWAAYLNQNLNKKIVSPKKWSGEIEINKHYDDLNLDVWNKIEN